MNAKKSANLAGPYMVARPRLVHGVSILTDLTTVTVLTAISSTGGRSFIQVKDAWTLTSVIQTILDMTAMRKPQNAPITTAVLPVNVTTVLKKSTESAPTSTNVKKSVLTAGLSTVVKPKLGLFV